MAEQAPNTTTCGGLAMPTAKNPNEHWECVDSEWVWFDDIGE